MEIYLAFHIHVKTFVWKRYSKFQLFTKVVQVGTLYQPLLWWQGFCESRLLWNRNTERSSAKLNRLSRTQSHYSQKCVTWTLLFPPFHHWYWFWELVKRVRGCSSLTLMYSGHLVHLCLLNREVNWHFNPIYERVLHQMICDEQSCFFSARRTW